MVGGKNDKFNGNFMRFVKGDQIRGKKASVFSLGPKDPSSTHVHDFWVINSKIPRVGTGAGRVRRDMGGGGGGARAGGGAQRRRPTGRHSSGVVNSGYLKFEMH
jgi:hypothetical protein